MQSIQIEAHRLVIYPEKTPKLPWPIGRVACGESIKRTSKHEKVVKDALQLIDLFEVENPRITIASSDDESIFAVWDTYPPEPLNPFDLWIMEDGKPRRLDLVKTQVSVSPDVWRAHDLLEKTAKDSALGSSK